MVVVQATRAMQVLVMILTWLATSTGAAAQAIASSPGARPQSIMIELTDTEREYVRESKGVKVALAGDTPPLYTITADKRIVGIVGDYLDWVSERTGLKFEALNRTTFQETVDEAAAGNADILPLFSLDPARLPGFAQTRIYINTPIAYIARRGLLDVSPNNSFGGYRVAVIRGTAAEDHLRRVMLGIKLQAYPESADALKAVSFGDADVFVGPLPLALYQIDRLLLLNLDLRGELNVGFGAYRMAISKKDPRLVSIVDKALNAITPEEDVAIRGRWSPAQTLLKPLDVNAALTEGERKWVNNNRELRVAYDREFAPFSFQDKDGVMAGLAADYLKLAEAKTGLKVATATGYNWAGALAAVRDNQSNLLVASARNDERRTYLSFVGPYAGVPTAIVGRLNEHEVTAMDDLAHSKVALVKAHFLIPEFRRRYPGLELVEVDTLQAALEYVEQRKVRAAIGNLNAIDPVLQRSFLGVLRVINTVPGGDSELYFAVPTNNPELARILRKGLDGITAQENAQLRQKWLSVTYQSGLPWKTLMQVGIPLIAAVLSILLVTLWWNRKLKAEVQRRTAAEALTAEALRTTRAMSEAKTRFLATMSHEIRGPVAGIIGTADAMIRRAESPDEKSRLKVIRDSGDHLVRLLTHVLDYTKAESGQFTAVEEWVSLRELLEESVNPFRYVAEQKGLQVGIVQRGPLPLRHRVDPLRLRQIISNLVSNAVKFTERGRIDIVLATAPVVGGTQRVWIRIQDTGPGIAVGERDKLFMPYGQTELGRKRGDSTGLGLNISKTIVEQLGGTLRLLDDHERETSGASFEIALTLQTTDAQEPARTTRPTVADAVTVPGGTPPRVLLADDDALNLALHREVLEGAGFVVDTATNGEQAFALWQRSHHPLIFSDGSMPIMSGLDFVKAVRAASRAADGEKVQAPWFVLLTSYSSSLDRDDYLRAGVDDFIEKPLLPRGLQEALARRNAAAALAIASVR
jgi:two-component system, NarL family, sensor histidine kinase EvgS